MKNTETQKEVKPYFAADPLASGDHEFRSAGLGLAYRVRGKGPVLVIQAPGWGIGAAPYELTFGPLERHHTVVYFHPRGSPRSDAPNDDAELNVGAMVNDLEALRHHLGLEQFALAGHSHGGLIALHYAAANPSRVTNLIIINSQIVGNLAPGERVGPTPVVQRDAEFAKAMEYFQSVGGFEHAFELKSDRDVATFLSRVVPLYFRRSQFARPLQEWLSAAEIRRRPLRATAVSDGSFPLTKALGRIKARTLIVSGAHDIICPASTAHALLRAIRGSELIVFQESGHFAWLEEEAAFFRKLTEFLTEVGRIV